MVGTREVVPSGIDGRDVDVKGWSCGSIAPSRQSMVRLF